MKFGDMAPGLFGIYHIEYAIYNLSTKPVRIFKVLVQRLAVVYI